MLFFILTSYHTDFSEPCIKRSLTSYVRMLHESGKVEELLSKRSR